jgi:hypothetical protein
MAAMPAWQLCQHGSYASMAANGSYASMAAMPAWQLQVVSSGFDIMYLALADRNMQVRFGLKVVWES